MNYNIINDYIVKIPKNHPYNKPLLKDVKVIISNNNVAQNSKLLIPLINTSLSVTGQYPLIISAKKSVASFKLRKDSPVGLITTLRGSKLENYLKLLNSYVLPRVVAAESSKGVAEVKFSKLAQTASNNSTLTFGINSVGVFSYITPLEESLQAINNVAGFTNSGGSVGQTGGYTQVSHSYTLPKQYKNKNMLKNIHKFYFSSLYFPMSN
jgi:large subunit ribosomal protein L5